MSRLSSITIAIVVLATAVASFFAGRMMAFRQSSETESATGWLQDAPAEVRQADLQFRQQAERLAQDVGSQRDRLSTMLADSATTDQQILAQVDRVIGSNTALIKAVGAHVAGLRSSLPQTQGRNLMASCAGSLQRQFQRRYRYRGGVQDQTAWQGRGAGRGRRYRGGAVVGQGAANPLQLTVEQEALLQTRDPNFNDDVSNLTQRLDQAQTALLVSFENAQTGNEELLAKVDNLTAAQTDLERRVARHVALMHPFLSPQQRQTLAQWVSTRGIDAGGMGG